MSIQECFTADDVRARARRTIEWRNNWFKPVKSLRSEVTASLGVPAPHTREIVLPEIAKGVAISARFMTDPDNPHYYIADIIDAVGLMSGFSASEIKGQVRAARYIRARHIAMALCCVFTEQSLPAIGRGFGGRDHTSVLHAARKMHSIMVETKLYLAKSAPLERWIAKFIELYDRDFPTKLYGASKQSHQRATAPRP